MNTKRFQRLLLGASLLLTSTAQAQSAGEPAGKALYDRVCAACHAPSNVMVSSPKAGDSAEWKRRLQIGLDQLTTNAIDGIGAMPPRGTCAQCTPAELREAIRYMAGAAAR